MAKLFHSISPESHSSHWFSHHLVCAAIYTFSTLTNLNISTICGNQKSWICYASRDVEHHVSDREMSEIVASHLKTSLIPSIKLLPRELMELLSSLNSATTFLISHHPTSTVNVDILASIKKLQSCLHTFRHQ